MSRYIAPSDKLNIAVLGLGGMGISNIKAVFETEKIVALCDVDWKYSRPVLGCFTRAKKYRDFRRMFDEMSKDIDAVIVATPDHTHAVIAATAMTLGKHVYVQKPLTHSVYESRLLTKLAAKYKVATQMGNQGSSDEGVDLICEWIWNGEIGEIRKVETATNRPVWPQGIPWPKEKPPVPKELNWDLWIGTAEYVDYVNNLVPFNWRGWWQFGTGALGDMGCHIIGPPFKLLELGYPTEVSCSVSTVYEGIFKEAYYPDCGPVSSYIRYKFPLKNGKIIELIWMDGGIMPERFDEIPPDVDMTNAMGDLDPADIEGATVFIGAKGLVSCGWGGSDPRLWLKNGSRKPLFTKDVNIPEKYKRIPGQHSGHYWTWIDSCIAGYDKAAVESPFEGYAGPLTEAVLMGNLVLRGYNVREKKFRTDSVYGDMEYFAYPGKNITYYWDGENMRITNFEAANQFVKRTYRQGWEDIKI